MLQVSSFTILSPSLTLYFPTQLNVPLLQVLRSCVYSWAGISLPCLVHLTPVLGLNGILTPHGLHNQSRCFFNTKGLLRDRMFSLHSNNLPNVKLYGYCTISVSVLPWLYQCIMMAKAQMCVTLDMILNLLCLNFLSVKWEY